MIWGVFVWQVVCIFRSWWLLFSAVWRNTVFVVRIHSKIVWSFRNRKFIAMRHRQNCWWYIRIKCWFFLHGHTILNRGHHTEITVNNVVTGTLKIMGTPNGIQRPFPFTYALSLNEHVMQQTSFANFLSWSPALQPKYKKYVFYCWSNRTFPWDKCHFSANIAKVVRVIYALLGHFYKYITQYMTVICQLKLSRHNSHERTWRHHLQYDRFCITLSKNWRELTGNNFIDHVTNTCSDDSR